MGARITTHAMPRKKITQEPLSLAEEQGSPKTTKARAKKAVKAEESAAPAPATKQPLFGRKPLAMTKDAEPAAPKEEEPAATTVEAPQPPAKKRASRGKVKKAEATDWDPDLPVPVFRARQPSAETSPAAKVEAVAEAKLAPRKSRRDHAEKKPPVEEPALAEVQFRPRVSKPKPVVEAKPIVPTPANAPQVILRDGIPTIVRDGVVFPPLFFFGSSLDARRAATVLEEMKLATDAGIHLHSHLVEFVVDPDAVDDSVQFAAYLLGQSVKTDPQCQVFFRIVFVAPKGWESKYQRAKYTTFDGVLAEPSVCDEEFWGDARECLSQFIAKLRLLPYAGNILGLHLERGEWFLASDWGYDTSEAAKLRFRDWAKTRYNEDIVALRAAWFDGDADFERLEIPPYQPDHQSEKFVRSDRKERKWVDYHLFLSDATVQRIADLAYTVKKASEGMFMVGVSYGYSFEWSHPASGHLSLGKLLRTPEIDIIAGPPSYRSREPGGTAPFPGPVDSFPLNGKLYVSEEDFKTSIGQGPEPDDFNPTLKTPQALETVHWRGAGSALAHASGICWMDLWGNGWLRTPSIWDRGRALLTTLVQRMAAPVQDPDVAVLIDERALAYLVDEHAFGLLVQNVREAVLRAGLSAGFYLLSDIAHREQFPEAKLYLFLNAWDIRSELRAAIKSRLQKDGKTLFWLYAAGLFDSGRDSLERVREVTGIALKPQPFHSRAGTTILNRRNPLCEAFPEGASARYQLDPTYFAIPEEAVVLGEYSQTGLPSFVVREFNTDQSAANHWRSIFLGEPLVTPAFLRALAQSSGAHIWNYQEDVTHVRPPFLTIHCTGTGPRTITLPNKWVAYNLLTASWTAADGAGFRFNANDGSTHLFLVGLKEDIEGILACSPDDLLRIDELPPKPENTTRFDLDLFDVPLMKLGEWIDGSDDELADDLLLRPHLIIDEAGVDAETEDASRRRRRRRRRDRAGTEEGSTRLRENEAITIAQDLDIGVVFRKRD